jgi:hypothetical protein
MQNEETTVAENTQRDADVATSKPNFELLSNDDYLNGTVNNTTTAPTDDKKEVTTETKTEEVKSEEVKTEDTKTEEETVESDLELKEEETKTETKEEKPEGETESDEFKLELEDDGSGNTEEEGDWIVYAKSEGLEIAENTVEAYIEAKTAPLKEEIEKAKSLTKESLLADLAPEHRLYMELAEAGMSHEDIVNPLKQIESYKSMSSASLYRADLEAKIEQIRAISEQDREWIDNEVEKKVESGDIEHEATRIRLELDSIEKNIIEERQYKIEQYKQQRETILADKRNQEVDSITRALDDMPEFMRQPLSKEVKKGLTDRYSSGKYDQILNDPAMKAKFIAFYELGEKALKNIEAKSYNKGKLEIANKLHNTPPLDNVNGSRVVQQTQGNFERLMGDPLLGT